MEPFIGEIILFGGNFAPKGWSFCNGQLLSIEVNAALYSILGTNYGGDGITTFGLPDLRGRVPIHPGTGVGLTKRALGEKGGSETISLSLNNVPEHNHVVSATVGMSIVYESAGPQRDTVYFVTPQNGQENDTVATALPNTPAGVLYSGMAGRNIPHDNMQPFQCINYIIALQGIYPART